MESQGCDQAAPARSRRVLGLCVRHPRPGQVKTRLARDWGEESACALYAAFLTDLIDQFRRLADRRILYYTPDTTEALDYFNSLAVEDYELRAQPEGDLGARLGGFFRRTLVDGHDRVVVLGSDSPTLPIRYVQQAFTVLEQSTHAVLGPAIDGGYYLIGLSVWRAGVFDEIDWSGPTVFDQQLQRFARHRLSVTALKPWYDVDTSLDVERLKVQLAPLREDPGSSTCPATLAVLQHLGEL